VIEAFGPRAEAYVRGLAHLELDAIVTDVEYLPQAYAAAMDRRVTGRPFYGMILYQDAPARFTMLNVASVFAQVTGFDDRRLALDQLAAGTMQMGDGLTVADGWRAFQDSATTYVAEFCAICDAMLVRSYSEYARLSAFCKRPRSVEPVVAVTVLPAIGRRDPERPGVVIWAPGFPSAEVIFHAFALEEFHGDVTCVTSDGVAPGPAARFITESNPYLAGALATATCILCVDPDDPGPAAAFAALGYGVAAPMSSGAYELVSDVVSFDLRSRDSIYAAVTVAIGCPATVREPLPPPPQAPRRPTLRVPPEQLPLVSVIVPTYNRRKDLTRALACLARQTYPRVEIIVVNDAGEDVRDIVASVPSAVYLTMPENGGVLRTEEMGFARATGEYFQALADDDFLDPDHIESLVTAMLLSGASMAHGNLVIRHQERIADGEYATVGYNARIFNETATPSLALLATPIAGQGMLVHQRVFDAVGGYDFDCQLADQEFQLRALEAFTFAYVDRMTAEFRARGSENFSTNIDSVPEQRRIYEELHPRPGRPYIERCRADVLVDISRRIKGKFAFPATLSLVREDL
jgi:GT2 family glycosyltransferase